PRSRKSPPHAPWGTWFFLDVQPLTAATAVFLDVAAESTRGSELAELVADHRLGDEDRDVLAAVVHGDRVPDHLRDDHGAARPRLDDVLGALLVLVLHLLQQVVVHEGALLKATWHQTCSLPLLLAAAPTPHDVLVAGLVLAAGTAFLLTRGVHRVAAAGGLALTTAVRVVHRVHDHTADGRALALPPHAAGLAPVDVGLLGVADLSDRGAAGDLHHPHLAGGHAQRGV